MRTQDTQASWYHSLHIPTLFYLSNWVGDVPKYEIFLPFYAHKLNKWRNY